MSIKITQFGAVYVASAEEDPRTTAHDLPEGSIILYDTKIYCKLDSGSSTNVSPLVMKKARNAQVVESYTPDLEDAEGPVSMDFATACTFIVPKNSDVAYVIDTVIEVVPLGVGITSIVADTDVNLNGIPEGTCICPRYHSHFIRKISTDEWVISHDVT